MYKNHQLLGLTWSVLTGKSSLTGTSPELSTQTSSPSTIAILPSNTISVSCSVEPPTSGSKSEPI